MTVPAQSTPAEREYLMKLLEQRREKFDAYATSIEKRSGIFGNKTKKDMLQSNQVLTEIVKTDNHIISVLNRTVDFKNYEKVNLNYDVQAHVDRVNKLLRSIDTLQKQVQVLNSHKNYLTSKLQRMQLITFFLVTISIIILVLFLRKKRTSSTLQS
jgi:hypothetical protein